MFVLTLESNDPQVSFTDRLHGYGSVATYRWDGDGHRQSPDLSGCQIGWHLTKGVSPFEEYAEAQANRLEDISSRIPDLRTRWIGARGYMQLWEPGQLSVTIAKPVDAGFDALLVSTVTHRLRLFIDIHVSFAEKDTAPAPSIQGFMERREPVFFNDAARFSPVRPDEVDEQSHGNLVMRYGRTWHRTSNAGA